MTIVPDARQPIVSIVTVIDGGQAGDVQGREGTAHLLEHLWYRSVTQEDGRTDETLADLGALWNAQTREDVTVFQTLAPAAALSRVLALEVHRLLEPLAGIDLAEIDAEREVVSHELQGNTEDGSIAFSALYPRLFPGHPYAATRADTPAGMASVGLADLLAYAAKNYRPEGTSLHIVGNVDPRAVQQLIDLTFPNELLTVHVNETPRTCAAHAPVSREPPEPLDTTLRRAPASVQSPILVVGWTLPGAWGADEAAARQATELLEDSAPDRVEGETEDVVCHYHPAIRASTVLCAREVPDGVDPDRFLKKVLPWRPYASDGDARSWERWRTLSLIKNLHGVLEEAEQQISPFDSGSDAALYSHFRGEPSFILGTLDSWASADRAAVEGVMQRYLTADRAVPVLLVPADAVAAGAVAVERANERTTAEGRLVAPKVAVTLPGLRDFTLENGLRVVILPYGGIPFVRATLAFRGGPAVEPKPGVDVLAEAMARPEIYNKQEGVSQAALIFGWGGSTFRWADTQGIGFAGPTGNLDALLYLLRASTERFELVESHRTDFVEDHVHKIADRARSPDAWADAVAAARVLPGHPLGRLQDAAYFEDTRLLRDADIQRWVDAVTRPENGTLLIVGNLDAQAAEDQVRARLADWVGRGRIMLPIPKLAPPPPPPARQVLLFPRTGDSLAMVSMHCQVGPLDPAEPERRDALEKVLQNAAWEALRVRNPLTYTPQVTVANWEGGTAVLNVRARVQESVAARVAEIELDLVSRLRDAQAMAAVGPGVRAELVRSWPSRLATTQEMLGHLLATARLGAPWSSMTDYDGRMLSLSDADLSSALDRCVGHEVVTIVGAAPPQSGMIGGVTPAMFDLSAAADAAGR